MSNLLYGRDSAYVSILVIAYNRLDKTKRCIESVIKYTENIDYELILVDNGSTDGTLEYFKSINCSNIKILRITKNLQAAYGIFVGTKYCTGQYIAFLNNDMIVTKNWLSNILKCFESDERIGLVCTMSSNISNRQQVDFTYGNYEEMQKKASDFNISDPKKWHERLRLITAGSVYKTECIHICGNFDYGFYHDFADDDLTFHIRRAGYKTVLCKDTFVCHDHVTGTEKNPGEFEKSLKIGQENFKKKYYGIDAWADVNNYEPEMIHMIESPIEKNDVHILGIDVLCGTPILEVKNKLKEFNIFDATLSSFTEKAKYFVDLSTICQGRVECDRIEYISEYFNKGQFDYILIGKEINLYSEPLKLLSDSLSLLKKGGQLLLKLRNTYDVRSFLNILGNDMSQNNEYPISWTTDDFSGWLSTLGYVAKNVCAEYYSMDLGSSNKLYEIIKYAGVTADIDNVKNKMLVRNYIFNIKERI
ncbi:glycosyltransferase family 2 protein [Lacrimispora brassicae]